MWNFLQVCLPAIAGLGILIAVMGWAIWWVQHAELEHARHMAEVYKHWYEKLCERLKEGCC